MSQNTETSTQTIAAATQENALPLSQISLLGTMIKPDSVAALVRVEGDKILRVTIGDQVSGATVAAIDEGVLMLAERGRTRKLTLPGQ